MLGIHLHRALYPRRGVLHLGALRNQWVNVLGHAGAHAAKFQIGLAVDTAHCAGEFIQGRLVDDMHRKAQRHPQRNRQQRCQAAPRLAQVFLQREQRQQARQR